MKAMKWILRGCGIPILILLIVVIAGMICWERMLTEEKKVTEEVCESPVQIKNSEAGTEEAEGAKPSTESAYWFIPQARDCLISEEEKEQLQSTVLTAAESGKNRNVLYRLSEWTGLDGYGIRSTERWIDRSIYLYLSERAATDLLHRSALEGRRST